MEANKYPFNKVFQVTNINKLSQEITLEEPDGGTASMFQSISSMYFFLSL